MKIYLVGGAVRDHIMGLPVSDKDYVVVGSSVDEMLSLGFKQVGADFPVFLHPETGEEYALARQERKTGKGYNGFEAIFDENTTLEDDLRRRDLTMNAMAMDLDTNEIIDPFGGQSDIKSRILRHTSSAFREDPVRVLRLARFAARYDFSIASSTKELVREIRNAGELEHLTSERIFKELEKTLKLKGAAVFVESLNTLGALKTLFPELRALNTVPAGPSKYHGEGSTLRHTEMVLDETDKFDNPLVRFGALVHDLGKGITPLDKLPSHPGHEEAGVPLVEELCKRLKMPTEYRRIGVICARHHGHVHKTFEMNAKSFVKIYKDFNRGHFEHDVDILIKVAEADHYGRISVDNARDKGYSEAEGFKKILTAIHKVKLSDYLSMDEIVNTNADRLKETFHRLRISAAKAVLRELKIVRRS